MDRKRSKIKLAVDIHHLLLESAGTKRVTVNLLEQFRDMEEIELIELTPSYSMIKGKGINRKIYGHFIRFFWVHIHLPILCKIKHADVLLSPEYHTPLCTGCKRAVIAHDAHIREQKEFINPLWFYCFYIPFIERAIRRSDIIFTVSQFAKKQIITFMRLDERKVHVVYNGIDKSFIVDRENSVDPSNNIKKQRLIYKRYVLFVGTFEARKNIERLIEAFVLFKKKAGSEAYGIKLAIVGKPSSGMFSDRSRHIAELIERLDISDDIVLCGYLTDRDLADLYKRSLVVAFPSLYEGFGLPILEGFASGVPVLTSNISSMPEIAGDAAVLVDPYNVDDIAEKLELIIFDKVLREQMILAGLDRVKNFRWKSCAKKIIAEISGV